MAFDTFRAPQTELLEDCVHCGFCLDTCPTYVLWGNEADSPRGRIVLIGEGLRPDEPMSDEMVTHFDRCLGCMACVTACPSGVRYDRLIERVRPQVERHHRRSLFERGLRRVVFVALPHPPPPPPPARARAADDRRAQARVRPDPGTCWGARQGRAPAQHARASQHGLPRA